MDKLQQQMMMTNKYGNQGTPNESMNANNNNGSKQVGGSVGNNSSSSHNNNNSSGGSSSGPMHDMAKIFVGGLSWQTTEETLRYHFEQYGEVVSVEVMRDRNTGDPRGFAFVVFQEDSIVDFVMSNAPHEINHKVVDVKRAQARGMAPPSIHNNHNDDSSSKDGSNSVNHNDNNKNTGGGSNSSSNNNNYSHNSANESMLTPEQLQNKVFVGGLPLHCDKDGLKEYFTQFGPVVDAIVMMDPHQRRSRGFGFVTFENGSGGAQIALQKQPLYMDGKYVEIKLATPKGEQHNHNKNNNRNNQYNNNNNHSNNNNNNSNNDIPNISNNSNKPNATPVSTANKTTGEFAGLAEAYGRNGWKAGYGSLAFCSFGWNLPGWTTTENGEENNFKEEGFSFQLLNKRTQSSQSHPSKRARYS